MSQAAILENESTERVNPPQMYEEALIGRSGLDFLTFLVAGPGSMAISVLTAWAFVTYGNGDRLLASWVVLCSFTAYFSLLGTLWAFQGQQQDY